MTTQPSIDSIVAAIDTLGSKPGWTEEDSKATRLLSDSADELAALRESDASLRAENEALKARVDDLAMLIRLLVHSLHKYNPDNETARRAVDYLRRHEILGSPLRHDLNSTPAADLEALDARVRREALGTGGVEAIAAERKRQVEVEGWTPEHDDEHDNGEMATAAACYAMARHNQDSPLMHWPWSMEWWKAKDRRSNLVRAGALIAAEIDRLDREAAILGPDLSAPEAREEGK